MFLSLSYADKTFNLWDMGRILDQSYKLDDFLNPTNLKVRQHRHDNSIIELVDVHCVDSVL